MDDNTGAAQPPGRKFFRDYDDSSDEEDLAQKTNATDYEYAYQQAYNNTLLNDYELRTFWLIHVLANRVLYSREVNQVYYYQKKPQLNEKTTISREDIKQLLTDVIKAVIRAISNYLLMEEDGRTLTEQDLVDLESYAFEVTDLEEIANTIYQQLNILKTKTLPEFLSGINTIFKDALAAQVDFALLLHADQIDQYYYRPPLPPETFQTDEYFAKRQMGFGSNMVAIALNSIKERIFSHTSCYNNGDARRNNPFTTNLTRVRNFTWGIVGLLNGSRSPQKAITPREQELIPLYLLDLIHLDNAAPTKSCNTLAWREATKDQHSFWFINFLSLNDTRIQHLIEIHLEKYTSGIVKGFFSANRPTLGNAHTFTSESPVHFLGNLRLANRSIKRELKNIQGDPNTRKVYASDCPKTVHFHWSFFKKPLVPALETQTVNASTATRTSMVDNAGSYAEVFTNIQKIQQVLSASGEPNDDQSIGLLLRAWFKGTLPETIATYSHGLRNIIFERISAIGYLLFGCEVTRNPGTLIINQMMLDLIISTQDPGISWGTLLTNNRLMPMAASDSIQRARFLNGYFNNILGRISPYSLDTSKDSLNTSNQGFVELYSSECALIQRWLLLKRINPRSNLNDIARSICQSFDEWFGNNHFDLSQFVLPQPAQPQQPAQRPRRGTTRQAK